MTLMPLKLNRHGGHYTLPVCRLDEGELEVDAALRELYEELGLDLGSDDVLGKLDQFPTRSGFRISPIVAWTFGEVELRPDPSEVAQVFHLPLRELASSNIPSLEESYNSDHPVLSAFLPTLSFRRPSTGTGSWPGSEYPHAQRPDPAAALHAAVPQLHPAAQGIRATRAAPRRSGDVGLA